jgi:para-nitrobenzyl esterase
VHDLIASPLAKGLFRRAIAESGGSTVGRAGISMGSPAAKDAEIAGVRFADAKGAKSIADLRAMTWQQLTQTPAPPADGSTSGGGRGTGTRGRGAMATGSPTIDGYVLPANVNDAVFQGKHNDVPVLTGMNTGELGGLVAAVGPLTLERFRSQATQRCCADREKFLALYPASSDAEAVAAQAAAHRDQTLSAMYLWARARSGKSKTKVFQFLFDHALPGPESARYGAFHAGEVPYVMNTQYNCPRPITDVDRKIAETVSSYWANFAAGGDPNGTGLPVWPSYGDKTVVMEIGDKNEPVAVATSAAKLAFFEAYLLHP